MTLNPLGAASAVLAAALLLCACNKPAGAPAAAPAALPPATAAPAPVGAPMAGGNKGPRLRIVCADDIKKFCAGADKPWKCLQSHQSELSQACQAGRAQIKAARQAARAAGGGTAAAQ